VIYKGRWRSGGKSQVTGCEIAKFAFVRECPLLRIHGLAMAGLETNNYQPVCVFNLEKLGLIEDS
jgi:hypothetical protein